MATKAILKRPPKLVRRADGELHIERFPMWRRIEHIISIVIFVLLVLTGFPQKFYETGWSEALTSFFGGLDRMRDIHRVTGILFTASLLFHVGVFVVGALTKRIRLTLLPTPQDLRDAYQNLRWYFGLRSDRPKMPKFDYRQKFEYVGLIMGSFIMVLSGVFLMWPVETSMALGGESLAASRVAHSNEAVLALLVLVVWHIYSVVLSPEVFPLDKSAFTGTMPLADLKHHHGREYDYHFPDGHPEVEALHHGDEEPTASEETPADAEPEKADDGDGPKAPSA